MCQGKRLGASGWVLLDSVHWRRLGVVRVAGVEGADQARLEGVDWVLLVPEVFLVRIYQQLHKVVRKEESSCVASQIFEVVAARGLGE